MDSTSPSSRCVSIVRTARVSWTARARSQSGCSPNSRSTAGGAITSGNTAGIRAIRPIRSRPMSAVLSVMTRSIRYRDGSESEPPSCSSCRRIAASRSRSRSLTSRISSPMFGYQNSGWIWTKRTPSNRRRRIAAPLRRTRSICGGSFSFGSVTRRELGDFIRLRHRHHRMIQGLTKRSGIGRHFRGV